MFSVVFQKRLKLRFWLVFCNENGGCVVFLVFCNEKWGWKKGRISRVRRPSFFFHGFSRRFLLFFGGGVVFLMLLLVFFKKKYLDVFAAVL